MSHLRRIGDRCGLDRATLLLRTWTVTVSPGSSPERVEAALRDRRRRTDLHATSEPLDVVT